ncbi:hypothetical protein JCM24511_10156 [Saitozyma sp. JCM 24511]|nr:hypothetical protein JCM24511_10156 [Saitozyma sp. JCM 24511]
MIWNLPKRLTMIQPAFGSRRPMHLVLSLGLFVVIMAVSFSFSRDYGSFFDPRVAMQHMYNVDVCRTAPRIPHLAPSRGELLELRERTRAAFPLSDSHAHLYNEFIVKSRSTRQQYHETVKRRLEYTGMEDCGAWPKEYARMHWESQGIGKQMGDPGAPKRIVHVALTRNGQNGGLGDRTLGQYQSPYIDWTLPNSPDPILQGGEKTKWTHKLRTGSELEDFFVTNKLENHQALAEYLDEEVGTYQTNYGRLIQALYDWDSWESRKLRKMGMTPENAWRCTTNFLFQPLPDTKFAIAHYHGLVAHPEIFSVAIQIRTGDGNLLDQPNPLDPDALDLKRRGRGQLQCAADLAMAYLKPHHKRVVFFISTDMDALAYQIAHNLSYFEIDWVHPIVPYPTGLSTSVKAIHLEKGNDHVGTAHNTLHDHTKQYAVQGTLLDNYVFEGCDWKLMDAGSGFGLIAHYRSYKEDSAYFMHRGYEIQPLQLGSKKCGSPEANFTLQEIVAGIKGG